MMSNLTALHNQTEQSGLYAGMGQRVRETASEVNGVVFIYSAGGPSYVASQVRGILESEPGLQFDVWSGDEPGSVAVLLPGLTLDAVHYQGLRLKQQLQERIADYRPRMALASFTSQAAITPQVLSQIEEKAKQNYSDDIYIFTKADMLVVKSRVLIVEGDPAVREFLQIRLNMQGYETMTADNGLTALDLIADWKPDLVLTELNLYGIDGLPYIHQIQKVGNEQMPKIVVLTEQRVEKTISLCFQNGVDDYITKPFSPVELDARIRRCIQ
ncbi:response regulator transcription factor [Paenibacillus sp. MB22_1]|jgi:CheY-like chemotaxis protein|nr:response regulator receiver domain protein [Paenibacillus sp. oral taxon 786 str. D14]SMF40353.1 Response regulators consisting of a CheY-like receiver domain and a winged-helix DNA-binding domain [Paenibacillus barengoltzii]